jgi:hypothetical protein
MISILKSDFLLFSAIERHDSVSRRERRVELRPDRRRERVVHALQRLRRVEGGFKLRSLPPHRPGGRAKEIVLGETSWVITYPLILR